MQSDAELITRSLAGDGEAFVEMIGRHETAVGAYLARRAGRDAADDLLGEVCAAYESRGAYDRAFPSARPWLLGVALNRLRRYWQFRSAEDLVPDLAGVAAGWDPWTTPWMSVSCGPRASRTGAAAVGRVHLSGLPGHPGRHRRRQALTKGG